MSLKEILNRIDMKLHPTRTDVKILTDEIKTIIKYHNDLVVYLEDQNKIIKKYRERLDFYEKNRLKVVEDGSVIKGFFRAQRSD